MLSYSWENQSTVKWSNFANIMYIESCEAVVWTWALNQAVVLHLMGLRIGNLVPNMRCDAEDSKTTKFQASP